MEADLARWYHIDYGDRWRGRLSLRRLRVLVWHLPAESALHAKLRDSAQVWGVAEHLLDDIRMSVQALTSKKRPKPHPQRPRPGARLRKTDPARERKLAQARARARARRNALEKGPVSG